jgi:hypothetical protein
MKRTSFAVTVIIIITLSILLNAVPVAFFRWLEWDGLGWLIPLIAFISLHIVFEVAARIGPQPFQTPLGYLVDQLRVQRGNNE